MAAEENASEKLEESDFFRRNAWIIISEMLELSKNTQEDTTMLVDELLHSIFFLGMINIPPYPPEMILGEKADELRVLYPEPFDRCASQVPRRSPFSCVLDMIVQVIGQEKEELIKDTLRELILDLRKENKSKCLFSFAICISQAAEDSVRYYGVSMSTSDRKTRRIMVAASCCSAWDDYVAGAVMTYFPDKNGKIDGTIKLPENVRCEAFSLSDGRKMPPCKLCVDLFSLHTNNTGNTNINPNADTKTPSSYGNCAEVESLSNLFKSNSQVKRRVRTASESWTKMNKDQKKTVETHLKSLLNIDKDKHGFKLANDKFYSPQRARETQ